MTPPWREIPWTTQYGDRISGTHYTDRADRDRQFQVEINWEAMTVTVKVLDSYEDNAWRVLSVTPLEMPPPGGTRR